MIQVIALRPYIDQKTGKEKKKHVLLASTTSVAQLFKSIDTIIETIPAQERWNVYYTALNCIEPAKCGGSLRRFKNQNVIPFDLDGIDTEKLEEYIKCFLETTGFNRTQTVIVFSGNGLQFIVQLPTPFDSTQFFEAKRLQYKGVCQRINDALSKANLPGGADPSVWSPARILRLPNTENRKPGKKGTKLATLLQGNLEPQTFDWDKLSGLQELASSDHIADWNISTKVDKKAILGSCKFLQWLQHSPQEVREPHFYAGLSIIGRMENGREISHRIQEAIKDSDSDSSVGGYSQSEVDHKLEQTLLASGPRTCKNINGVWGKCSSCAHFMKITSPIQLKSPEFIATSETGFYYKGKNGLIPAYEDLLKFFDQKHIHVSRQDSGLVYVYDGKLYKKWSDVQIKNFALTNFKPFPKAAYMDEFYKYMKSSRLVDKEFFEKDLNGLINLQNGILNIKTRELIPHSHDKGFQYVLPYSYDPDAIAPRFSQFLDEVTGGDKQLRAILEEYGGYALSGDEYWEHKALVLVGEGKNGKSKFINALRYVAGDDNYSSVSLREMNNVNMRQLMEGKLFNVASELGKSDLRETDVFKKLTEGAALEVKMMWHQPYMITNRAKLIFATNTIPAASDDSYGFLRRLILVPFDQTFEGEKEDQFLDAKFKAELPGIFNIFLEGYQRLCSQKGFTKSKVTEELNNAYAETNNTVSLWLSETDMVKVNELNGSCTFVTTEDLYAQFVMWCETMSQAQKNKGLAFTEFSRAFARAIPKGKERASRVRINGPAKRGFFDIEFFDGNGDKTYLRNTDGRWGQRVKTE